MAQSVIQTGRLILQQGWTHGVFVPVMYFKVKLE